MFVSFFHLIVPLFIMIILGLFIVPPFGVLFVIPFSVIIMPTTFMMFFVELFGPRVKLGIIKTELIASAHE